MSERDTRAPTLSRVIFSAVSVRAPSRDTASTVRVTATRTRTTTDTPIFTTMLRSLNQRARIRAAGTDMGFSRGSAGRTGVARNGHSAVWVPAALSAQAGWCASMVAGSGPPDAASAGAAGGGGGRERGGWGKGVETGG